MTRWKAMISVLVLGIAAGLCRAGEPAASRTPAIPAGRWVPMNEPSAGVQMLGWDDVRYSPDLGGIVFFGAYRGYTSENQNAIWLYRFRENRWRLLHLTQFFHRDEMTSDAGHTSGRLAYDQARRVLVYGGLVSMGRNDRARTWVFDPFAQVGWDAQPPVPVPGIPFDAATIYVPELKGTFLYHPSRGAWLYDATANRWTQIAAAGTGPGAGCAEAVYDGKRTRVLVFGGSQGEYSGKSFTTFNDLWAFDVAKRAWTKLEPKTEPAAMPPPRGWPQVALSPEADALVVAGGASGVRDAQAGIVMLKDTWVLDLAAMEWKELKDAGYPGSSVSNHLVYDPANRVFLLLGGRGGLGYGYSCGMYALRLEGDGPAAAAPPPEPAPAPTYDLASLPKAAGVWADLAAGPLAAVNGWCQRPSLAARGAELLLAFTEYPEWPGSTSDPVFYARVFRLAGGAWTELAGGDFNTRYPFLSNTPAVGFDTEGRAVMVAETYRVWQRAGLSAFRFENGAWRTLGANPEGEKGGGYFPAFVGGDGAPAVAHQFHPQGLLGIAVAAIEWRDGRWQPVGAGRALNAGNPIATRAEFPVLLRDREGRLVVAWREHRPDWTGPSATPERICVRRFQEGVWAPVGDTVPVLQAEARAVSFAMTLHQGEPVVAACEGTDAGRTSLVVHAWQKGAWVALGEGALNVFGDASGALRPAVVSDGTALYAAWPEFLPNRPPLLFVKRWDGRAWALVGGPLNAAPGAGSVHEPALAILDGRPVVAWTEFDLASGRPRRIHAKRME